MLGMLLELLGRDTLLRRDSGSEDEDSSRKLTPLELRMRTRIFLSSTIASSSLSTAFRASDLFANVTWASPFDLPDLSNTTYAFVATPIRLLKMSLISSLVIEVSNPVTIISPAVEITGGAFRRLLVDRVGLGRFSSLRLEVKRLSLPRQFDCRSVAMVREPSRHLAEGTLLANPLTYV